MCVDLHLIANTEHETKKTYANSSAPKGFSWPKDWRAIREFYDLGTG